MKKSDLYREWARVLDMCEGTKVSPLSAWKFGGVIQYDRQPNFECYKHDLFEFAVSTLEDRPVFIGDKIYSKEGAPGAITVTDHSAKLYFNANKHHYTWTPPKKTFLLNGEVVPCPNRKALEGSLRISANFSEHHFFYFDSSDDAVKSLYALSRILNEESTG